MQLSQTTQLSARNRVSTSNETFAPSSSRNNTQRRESTSFSSNMQFILMLIIRLLAQLQGTGTTTTPAQEPETPVQLTDSEKNVLTGLYASDPSGIIDDTKTMTVIDGSNNDKKLSVGDRVVVKSADGSIVSERKISVDDIYKIRFRERIIQYSESMPRGGWLFDTEVVNIRNSISNTPITRPIENGNGEFETVLKKNTFWEVVERNGNKMLLQRSTDDNGRPILASEALKDLYRNRMDYSFDCASPISILNLMATLGTVGEDSFNKNAGRLLISSWLDPYDAQSNFDGGFLQRGRAAEANTITVDGHSNLAGELAIFDTNRGDELRPGSTYYFDKPGDNSSAFQGWNAVYLGKDEEDVAKFWVPSLGVKHVKFTEGTWLPSEGTFKGYYLGSIVGSPDYLRLEDWDHNESVLA